MSVHANAPTAQNIKCRSEIQADVNSGSLEHFRKTARHWADNSMTAVLHSHQKHLTRLIKIAKGLIDTITIDYVAYKENWS